MELRDPPTTGMCTGFPQGRGWISEDGNTSEIRSAGAWRSAPHGARMPRLSTSGRLLHLPLLLFRLRGLSVEEARVHSRAGQRRGDALCHMRPPSHSGGSFRLGEQIQTQATGQPGKAQRQPRLWGLRPCTRGPLPAGLPAAPSRAVGPGGQGCREWGSCPVPACVATHNHVHTQWIPPSPEPRTGLPKLTWSRPGQVSGSRPPALTWTPAAAPISTRAPTPGLKHSQRIRSHHSPASPGTKSKIQSLCFHRGCQAPPAPLPVAWVWKPGGGPGTMGPEKRSAAGR